VAAWPNGKIRPEKSANMVQMMKTYNNAIKNAPVGHSARNKLLAISKQDYA
jgi:hypothetical protein